MIVIVSQILTKMGGMSITTIVIIHAICIFVTRTDGFYFGSRVSILNQATSNGFSQLDSGESLQKIFHDDWDIEPGCKCLNGKCEKTCIKEKNGVCRQTGNVCVCDAEFFKVNEETCIYCGCGKGFNCTFYHVTRTCECPEGFYIRDNKCAANCSDDKPCQNGGKCIEGECKCNNGTSGTFCESSDWCKKKCNQPLLVDCVYQEKENDMHCLCKNRFLVYDFQERICKPCPCGEGSCETQNETLTCNCKPGYKPHKKQCLPCDCGRDGICDIAEKGEKICQCKDNDFPREGKCIPCDCGHKDAKCKTNKEGRKECVCPYGYEDILGKCIKMNKDDRRCLCHPTANCVETFDSVNEFNCTCNEGYKGKIHDIPHVGEECVDIDECQYSNTCPDRKTTDCINFEGSYLCRCKTGYQPVDVSTDSRKVSCENYKMSWAPTGVAIAIIIIFIAIAVGALLFLKKKSLLFSSSPAIELQNADYKRVS